MERSSDPSPSKTATNIFVHAFIWSSSTVNSHNKVTREVQGAINNIDAMITTKELKIMKDNIEKGKKRQGQAKEDSTIKSDETMCKAPKVGHTHHQEEPEDGNWPRFVREQCWSEYTQAKRKIEERENW